MDVVVEIGLMAATVGGTADAIEAIYVPVIDELTDKRVLGFRATGPNLTATPTFSPDGLDPKVITQKGGLPLVPGSIFGDDYDTLVVYNEPDEVWELINPANVFGTTSGTCAQGNDSRFSASVSSFTATQALADSTTYYFGGTVTIPSLTDGNRAYFVPDDTVMLAKIDMIVFCTTLGSTESIPLYFRVNSTTDTFIGNIQTNTANNVYHFSASVTVADTDTWQLKLVVPVMATNPTVIITSLLSFTY
jgi:hypothetical protein